LPVFARWGELFLFTLSPVPLGFKIVGYVLIRQLTDSHVPARTPEVCASHEILSALRCDL
jgi:hypothetical protein